MIASQQIKNTTSKIKDYKDYEKINVLKWKNSKYKALCPYYLKTDGKEEYVNRGNIIFENFYQGAKMYDKVYKNKVYPSRFYVNDANYLWWNFIPLNENGDVIVDENDEIDYDNYLNWRNSLWNCANPIRYPNKIHRRKNTKFSIIIDKKNKIHKLNYLQARKRIYVKEYIRLVKKLPEYEQLLDKLKENKKFIKPAFKIPNALNNFVEIEKIRYYESQCVRDILCHYSGNDFKYRIAKNKKNFRSNEFCFFSVEYGDNTVYVRFENLEKMISELYENNQKIEIDGIPIHKITAHDRFGEVKYKKNYADFKNINEVMINYYYKQLIKKCPPGIFRTRRTYYKKTISLCFCNDENIFNEIARNYSDELYRSFGTRFNFDHKKMSSIIVKNNINIL